MERTKRHLPAAALSVLLSLTLAFCMIPDPAFATEGEQESGSAEADTTAVDNAESDIAGNETEGQQNAADDELGEGVIAGEQIDAADDEPVAGEADNGDEGESSQPEEQKTQVPVPQGKELIFNGEWQLGIDAAGIKPESRLVEDLKADSLDVVAMVMEMESQYGIQIPDEDLTKLKTVADVMQYIQDNQK